MKSRKELKADARKILKRHYWMLVVLCLAAAVLGTECTSSLSGVKISSRGPDSMEGFTATGTSGITQEFSRILMDGINQAALTMEEKEKEENRSDPVIRNPVESDQEAPLAENKGLVLGRSRGVLAMLVNGFTSGSFLVALIVGIKSIVGSGEAAIEVFVILSLGLVLILNFFVINVYQVIIRRMYLESRCYSKVRSQRLLCLLKVRRWGKTAVTLLLQTVYQSLWSLTIVGGFIKAYSYILVPYIVAENPDIRANEAITLSRKLMKGYKWKCFVLDLSFIGWDLLGALTGGILNLFYVNPYRMSAMGEFYVSVRRAGKEKQIERTELLNDKYLYERPEGRVLERAYADVLEAEKEPPVVLKELTGIRRVIADVFGVVVWNSKDEEQYEKESAEMVRLARDKEALEGKCYPARLHPIPEKEKRSWMNGLHYIRHYSVWSLVMIFFIMSFGGWVWEVSLHFITDGNFVNRGILHGPWLPIYGTGSVLILMLLNRLRRKPALEFVMTILLCGGIEYYIAWHLEQVYDGMKWWDYNGYFLNLDGRICAEGLLTFGLGGMAIVYVLAPLLDNMIQRIPKKTLVVTCLVLLSVFCVDKVYSDKKPNMGEGITDYQSLIFIEEGSLVLPSVFRGYACLNAASVDFRLGL